MAKVAKNKKRAAWAQFNPFQPLSENAARLERAGRMREAKEAWEMAAKQARHLDNIAWCQARAAFCERFKRLAA